MERLRLLGAGGGGMNHINLREAVAVVAGGGIVAFPTETYYGLAADPFNEEALARLYALKQRSQHKPLLTLLPNLAAISSLVSHVPPCLTPFMELWPAPLTLVCPALPTLSPLLTARTATIGVRLSPHPLAHQFLTLLGQPVTATSANISGQAPACSAPEVAQQFGGQLDYIVDGGHCPGGLGSTLIGCLAGKPCLLRAGVVPFFSLKKS